MKRIALLLLLLALAPSLWATEPKKGTERKEAGAARVYRFDNLDIEGHVKTPQLMVFFKRVKNRFKSFRLPKQEFSQKTLADREADFLR